MPQSSFVSTRFRLVCALTLATALAGPGSARPRAQASAKAGAQKIDADYTAKIKAATADPRILTELVDHMPASDKVPSPLKFLGYIPGEPGKMTYHKDIVRYLDALDKASDRVTMMKIGETDEGRDMVAVAIADEATIRNLDKYRQITAQLTDPRKLSDAQARQLIATGKPIYYATGSIHSPETGSPEMLMELAYRLAIEETPFIQTIRNNAIVVFTPSSEVDGREKQVDNFRAQAAGQPSPSMVYWGKYVQHDNNRDGIGVGLRLTQVMLKTFLEWHPTVWHDLHESVTLLYTSTGTGPYNSVVDPIQVNEWWLLAQTEIMEMTKRDVPGVWTYNYYDGWVPNYMFWIGVTHNSIGRFYETQSYQGAVNRPLPVTQSREWYRPNPTPSDITWGPRNNVNMQQSALLLAMNYVAKNKETFLENYYLKNKHTIERGKAKPPYAYVVPASQRRRVEAAELMNLIRREGAEVHVADGTFSLGSVEVAPGDYIVRLDQPYGAIVETLLGLQFYAPENPRPYDDTGWAIPLVRNVKSYRVEDKTVFEKPMTLATSDFKIAGAVAGTGARPDRRPQHRQHPGDVPLPAQGREDVGRGARIRGGRPQVRRGRVHHCGRQSGGPGADDQGARTLRVGGGGRANCSDARPGCSAHRLRTHVDQHAGRRVGEAGIRHLPGALHILRRTEASRRQPQIEVRRHRVSTRGAGRLGPDHGGIQGNEPRPYKKSETTPNVGTVDTTDDMRGSIGVEGLMELLKFVQEGGLLITEGATSTVFPEYNLTPGVSIETPDNLYVRGSILKALLGDRASPVLYGYDQNALAVYFNQAPVMRVGAAAGGGRAGPNLPGIPNMQPNAVPPRLTTLDGPSSAPSPGAEPGRGGRGGRGGAQAGAAEPGEDAPQAGGRGGGRGGGAAPNPATLPRVLLSFPTDPNDLLLSGLLVGGETLAGRAVAIDSPVGKGHVVMFANRPYWRWQTQGNFFLGFNAILNWNDLDAGRAPMRVGTGAQ